MTTPSNYSVESFLYPTYVLSSTYAALKIYGLTSWLGLTSSPAQVATDLITSMSSDTTETYKNIKNEIHEQLGFGAILLSSISVASVVVQVSTHILGAYAQAYLRHMVGRPKLAMDYEFQTWSRSISRVITAPYNLVKSILFRAPLPPARPVFKPEIQKQLEQIEKSIQHIRNNNGYFTNLLLYGPPGTGKTMISKLIAKESGMNYVMMSGGELTQFIKRGEHVSELNHLFENAKNASSPTIIFIDEADALARNRDQLSMERIELLNALLTHTGEPSKKVMLILATNRPQDLDVAVRSRMDNQIMISPPEKEERLKILKLYLDRFFTGARNYVAFDDTFLDKINEQIEGLSGREIFKLCNAFAIAKASQANNKLTEQLVEETIQRVLKNKAEIEQQINAA